MLYPTVIDPQPSQVFGLYMLDPGQLAAFTLTLGPTDSFPLTVVQGVPTQDWSLKCWISRKVGGSPVVDQPYNQSYWHPTRVPYDTLVVFGDQAAVPSGNALKLPAGTYFLHVLNLTNVLNGFKVDLPA